MSIPLAVKVLHTLFVIALVPAYWIYHRPGNFLWFSDIALFVSVVALWSENAFLASMQAVGVAALETLWIVDFLTRLIAGVQLTGLSNYMFNAKHPLWIRGLSLFHLWLPILLLWMVHRFGYDPRAWMAQTLLAWLVLPLSYAFTAPAKNVNWVHGIGAQSQTRLHPWRWLVLLMIAIPLCVYWPTHLVLERVMPHRA
ncbi:MAG: hypothetical protein WD894_17660 [Pirellulales bacterium]